MSRTRGQVAKFGPVRAHVILGTVIAALAATPLVGSVVADVQAFTQRAAVEVARHEAGVAAVQVVFQAEAQGRETARQAVAAAVEQDAAVQRQSARAAATDAVAQGRAVLDASPNAAQGARDALEATIDDVETSLPGLGSEVTLAVVDVKLAALSSAHQGVAESQAAWQAGEDARVLASQQAGAATKAASAPKVKVSTPKAAGAATDAAASNVSWSTFVGNSGGQAAVDARTGGVTLWNDRVDGKPYYPIHRDAGGAPILGLGIGDLVAFEGATWQVTDIRTIAHGDSYAVATGMNGSILMQTCYPKIGGPMKLIALTQV